MLEVDGLSYAYGKHEALHEVSLRVARGETVVILGANGAGKTTLLNAVAGLVMPRTGRVRIDGVAFTGLPAHDAVTRGIAMVPEGRRLFGEMTVRENLMLGAFPAHARKTGDATYRRVMELFPRLAERQGQLARTMSGGEQQMVAIGRAMMSRPQFLLLDEPSLGLSPLMCQELFAALATLGDTETGILLVEQNAKRSLELADRGYLLEHGRIVGKGQADDLAADPAVARSYLGT